MRTTDGVLWLRPGALGDVLALRGALAECARTRPGARRALWSSGPAPELLRRMGEVETTFDLDRAAAAWLFADPSDPQSPPAALREAAVGFSRAFVQLIPPNATPATTRAAAHVGQRLARLLSLANPGVSLRIQHQPARPPDGSGRWIYRDLARPEDHAPLVEAGPANDRPTDSRLRANDALPFAESPPPLSGRLENRPRTHETAEVTKPGRVNNDHTERCFHTDDRIRTTTFIPPAPWPRARVAPVDPWPTDGRADASAPRWLLHPGSGSRRKNWPAEHFAEIARRLHRTGAQVAVVVGPADDALLEPLAMITESTAALWRGLPLDELAARLAWADGYLGNDSGVTHLAAAAGAGRVLVLFGATDPEVWHAPDAEILRAPDGRLDLLDPDTVWRHLRHPAPPAPN